jgi:hypothetical protein
MVKENRKPQRNIPCAITFSWKNQEEGIHRLGSTETCMINI